MNFEIFILKAPEAIIADMRKRIGRLARLMVLAVVLTMAATILVAVVESPAPTENSVGVFLFVQGTLVSACFLIGLIADCLAFRRMRRALTLTDAAVIYSGAFASREIPYEDIEAVVRTRERKKENGRIYLKDAANATLATVDVWTPEAAIFIQRLVERVAQASGRTPEQVKDSSHARKSELARRKRRWLKTAAVLALLGLVAAIGRPLSNYPVRDLQRNGARTEGVVLDIAPRKEIFRAIPCLDYSFQTPGGISYRRRAFLYSNMKKNYRVGDEVAVVYAPDNPDANILADEFENHEAWTGISLGLCMLGSFFGFLLLLESIVYHLYISVNARLARDATRR